MDYLLKSGILYAESVNRKEASILGELVSDKKRVTLPTGDTVMTTYIQKKPDGNTADVHQKRYIMADESGRELASAIPEYAEGEDPDLVGWPVHRMPLVDHAALKMNGKPYTLSMKNAGQYSLSDGSGNSVLQISHRGLQGGWNIHSEGSFKPSVICGIYAFCRYIEKENELMVV